jgi:hypothetical protein
VPTYDVTGNLENFLQFLKSSKHGLDFGSSEMTAVLKFSLRIEVLASLLFLAMAEACQFVSFPFFVRGIMGGLMLNLALGR